MNLLECVELVEETKENSKNALIEKGLELDESYGLSQVDEKIAEIQAGGGGNKYLSHDIEDSLKINDILEGPKQGTFNVKVKIDTPSTSNYNLKLCYGNVEFVSCSKVEDVSSWNSHKVADFQLGSGAIDESVQFTVKGTDSNCYIFVVLYQSSKYGSPMDFTSDNFIEALTIPVRAK